MSTQDIVQKLWNLCNVLRDDGITYHQYVTELTYILFLKMINEIGREQELKAEIDKQHKKRLKEYCEENNKKESDLTAAEKEKLKNALDDYSWDYLKSLEGIPLKKYYNLVLKELGQHNLKSVNKIFEKAVSNIEEPRNLRKLILEIDKFEYYDLDNKEMIGDLYEELLEKNATEKKSGAGQYFTPRVLIKVMTELIDPQFGERCFDPACGTFGFLIAAYKHITKDIDRFALKPNEYNMLQESFTGIELVNDTYRLALMNAYLHLNIYDIDANIKNLDSLSTNAKGFKEFDVILTNPPFGTKKGGERTSRDDISFQTSNKQLNFLQVIYRSLKADGKARCAVVLPDNVLFAGGDGVSVRREMMNFCNLHTILRLPTGIFYAQGVKTNVLFFTRGKTEKGNTKEVAFYDMRTNMDSFGKTRQLKKIDFEEFMEGYKDTSKRTGERWSKFTREQIENEHDDSLDLGLIKDDSIIDADELPDPIESGEEAIAQLEEAVDLLKSVVRELKTLTSED